MNTIVCKICKTEANHCARQLCFKCYRRIRHRAKKHNMTWEESFNVDHGLCKCGNEVAARGLCKSCYGRLYRRGLNTKKYLRVPDDDESYIRKFACTKDERYEEDTETYEEYLSRRYDRELKRIIETYEKTGRVIDNYQG